MISDCEYCWDTPCTCGWDYRNWDLKQLIALQETISWVIAYRTQHPHAKFSQRLGDPKTKDDISLLKTTGAYTGD